MSTRTRVVLAAAALVAAAAVLTLAVLSHRPPPVHEPAPWPFVVRTVMPEDLDRW